MIEIYQYPQGLEAELAGTLSTDAGAMSTYLLYDSDIEIVPRGKHVEHMERMKDSMLSWGRL